MMKTLLLASILSAVSLGVFAQNQQFDDEEPSEYRGRQEQRDAYRRGYERGYDRGYRKGIEEGRGRPPVIVPAPPPAPVRGPIRVTRAVYGSSSRRCDAFRYVTRQANGRRSHSFKVTNAMCGDPDHGDRKTLEVEYTCGDMVRTASAREHQDIYLNCN